MKFFVRLGYDNRAIRHSDKEELRLSFRCFRYAGSEYMEVDGAQESFDTWAGREKSAATITEAEYAAAKKSAEIATLETEISEMESDVREKRARYTTLTGTEF